MKKIMRFLKEEEGLEMSEYAIMGAIICILLVAAVTYLKDAIDAGFRRIADTITSAT